MDESRIAMNEATFRRVNEAIQAGRPDAPGHVDLICECGRLGCAEHLHMSADAYRSIRSSRRRFAVVPGHEIPEVERLVETGDGYLVVEKEGEAARLVERVSREPLPELGLGPGGDERVSSRGSAG